MENVYVIQTCSLFYSFLISLFRFYKVRPYSITSLVGNIQGYTMCIYTFIKYTVNKLNLNATVLLMDRENVIVKLNSKDV